MPYTLLQGGRRRRRRRRGAVLAAILLAIAATLLLSERAGGPAKTPPKPPPAPPAALLDTATAPLAGGGTAPSPLAVRLEDPRDSVRVRFRHPPRSGLLFDVDTGRVLWRGEPPPRLPIAPLAKKRNAPVGGDPGPPPAPVH